MHKARLLSLICIFAAFAAAIAKPEVDEALLEARNAQNEVDATTEAMMRALSEIEIEFHKKKIPLYAKRNQILSKVTGFWGRVVENHPNHGGWIRGDDKDVLPYITEIGVQDLPGDPDAHMLHHYILELHFAPNPYFSDAKLWRQIKGHVHDDHPVVSGVHWYEGKAPTEASFFNFFEKSEDRNEPRLETHLLAEIGHIFRYEFFPNPFTYHDLPRYHELMNQQAEADHFLQENDDGVSPQGHEGL
jgi:template-activating factor I